MMGETIHILITGNSGSVNVMNVDQYVWLPFGLNIMIVLSPLKNGEPMIDM